ncbi:MAG TPA: serine hydrolase domain-containing protein [Flavitalea sp.]|nr:serine hydrolase domain-containing protein [Flavitalea sp.]
MTKLFVSSPTLSKLIFLLVIGFFLSCSSSHPLPVRPVKATDPVWSAGNITAFERKLEALRLHYHIPSLSVGIVNEKKLTWKKGFGYSDIENKKVPDENTAYHLASVTKTFGAIILMQLVEQGKLSLEDPIAKYGINLGGRWGSDERIKVKHLLTHTAKGNALNGYTPGTVFHYDGGWYNRLGEVIEKASGNTFGQLLMKNIIEPLHLRNTVPSLDDSIHFRLTGYNMDSFAATMAKPYNWAGKKYNPVQMSYGFGPAAGIISTVADLAKYSVAIDDQKFLKPQTWEKMFTPIKTTNGKSIQYGLGWFIKSYNNTKIVWHTGWWFGYSTLFVKIPEKDLTFIILANSQDLSRPFYLTLYPVPLPNPFVSSLTKDLMISDFARLFIEHFVGL